MCFISLQYLYTMFIIRHNIKKTILFWLNLAPHPTLLSCLTYKHCEDKQVIHLFAYAVFTVLFSRMHLQGQKDSCIHFCGIIALCRVEGYAISLHILILQLKFLVLQWTYSIWQINETVTQSERRFVASPLFCYQSSSVLAVFDE